MCGKEVPAETMKETEGFCSYECSSGGGFKAPSKVKEAPRQFCQRVQLLYTGHFCPYCYGKCVAENGPHKRPSCDTCGYDTDEEDCVTPRCAKERPPTWDWCPKTADHKHVNGPGTVVGQSWHGPVHSWECTKCAFHFCDH